MFKVPILILSFFLVVGAVASQKEVDDMHAHIYTLMKAFPDSADALTDISLQLSQESDYEWGIGNSYFIKGFIAKKQNHLGRAMVHYIKALEVLEVHGSMKFVEAKTKLLMGVGNLLRDHQMYDDAIEFYDRSLVSANRNSFRQREVKILYNRGSNYQEQGQYELAILDLQKSHTLALALSDEFHIVNSLNLLGLTYMYQGQYHKARDTFKKIVRHSSFQSLDALEYDGLAYHNIARTFYLQEDYLSAEKWFQKAVETKEQRKNAEDLFSSYADLAETMAKNDKYDEAYKAGQLASKYYNNVKLTVDHLEVFRTLREVSYNLGKYQEANQYSSRYEEETSKYLEEQQKIFEAKEQFTKELITAGFFQSKDTTSQFSLLNYLLLAIIILGSGALLVYRYLWMRRKLSIAEEIRAINIESNF